MQSTNLPTDLLRTFVTVLDLGGYTRAAELLGRTQPAISLQMRRLEGIVGTKLVTLQGRDLRLTEDGEILSMYARQILRLNDDAVAKFQGIDAERHDTGRAAHRLCGRPSAIDAHRLRRRP